MPSNTRRFNTIFTAFCYLSLSGSIFLRIWHLGNIPGLNGDEAYYGVQSLNIIHGKPVAWFTPSGNFSNLLYTGPCILLHLLFAPSFVLLRANAVVFGLLALCANYLL